MYRQKKKERNTCKVCYEKIPGVCVGGYELGIANWYFSNKMTIKALLLPIKEFLVII